MTLEAVVYPQEYPFSFGCKDFYSFNGGGSWGSDFISQDQQGNNEYWDYCSSSPSLLQNVKDWDPNTSPEACTVDQSCQSGQHLSAMEAPPQLATTSRRKRRRTKSSKNKEEIENQRMTHIVVERNRRKQMNEYLAVLRSLMPQSYAQRGDQASIVGGAINFVKELEQLCQSMNSNKRSKQQPLADFFTFPQFSTRATQNNNSAGVQANESNTTQCNNNQWAAADIEVTMVDNHANLKILSKKRPRQLLKMVAGLQSLRLSVLHLNVTTADEMVLYSVSVKIEEGCPLNTVDEIAAAVNQMLRTIQEAAFS
ncbi:transcription factor bHLH96 isoform X1 [Pyrus x bretschneideri]|uniref:transcription factor bHLH96 isoform X1 n=1 Tax=Pyrus x bretschneideri TaxID=225117 RepID=UPI0005111875|nr:transcription factor bHLH96 isoform X1 [Pyrus x bretschneideri]